MELIKKIKQHRLRALFRLRATKNQGPQPEGKRSSSWRNVGTALCITVSNERESLPRACPWMTHVAPTHTGSDARCTYKNIIDPHHFQQKNWTPKKLYFHEIKNSSPPPLLTHPLHPPLPPTLQHHALLDTRPPPDHSLLPLRTWRRGLPNPSFDSSRPPWLAIALLPTASAQKSGSRLDDTRACPLPCDADHHACSYACSYAYACACSYACACYTYSRAHASWTSRGTRACFASCFSA